MDDLDQLYQDILLDHYKNPRNREALPDDEVLVDEENPTCGDQIRLTARMADGRIAGLRFDGKGCAISQASASMMTELLAGKSPDEARALIDQVVKSLRGEQEFGPDLPEDLLALGGVRKYPLRVKCATMSWHGMDKVLNKIAP